jgi:hypothetical protein
MCPFITEHKLKTEHSVQHFMYLCAVICISVVMGMRINPAVTNMLSEALSRECMFPETVAQQWSVPHCFINSMAMAHFHGYALSEALPSNGLFRLSGVMSQYGGIELLLCLSVGCRGRSAPGLNRSVCVRSSYAPVYTVTAWLIPHNLGGNRNMVLSKVN